MSKWVSDKHVQKDVQCSQRQDNCLRRRFLTFVDFPWKQNTGSNFPNWQRIVLAVLRIRIPFIQLYGSLSLAWFDLKTEHWKHLKLSKNCLSRVVDPDPDPYQSGSFHHPDLDSYNGLIWNRTLSTTFSKLTKNCLSRVTDPDPDPYRYQSGSFHHPYLDSFNGLIWNRTLTTTFQIDKELS